MGIFDFIKPKTQPKLKTFTFSHYVIDYVNHEAPLSNHNVDELLLDDPAQFDLDLKIYIIDEQNKYGLYILDIYSPNTLDERIESHQAQFTKTGLSMPKLNHHIIVNLINSLLNQLQSEQHVTSWQDFDQQICAYMLPIFYSPEHLPDPDAPSGYQVWRHRWQ